MTTNINCKSCSKRVEIQSRTFFTYRCKVIFSVHFKDGKTYYLDAHKTGDLESRDSPNILRVKQNIKASKFMFVSVCSWIPSCLNVFLVFISVRFKPRSHLSNIQLYENEQ